jgi:uncharacterized protein YjbI with pentapeptide repeats
MSEKYKAPSVIYNTSPKNLSSLFVINEDNSHKQNYEAYEQHFLNSNAKMSKPKLSNAKMSNLKLSNAKMSNLKLSNANSMNIDIQVS